MSNSERTSHDRTLSSRELLRQVRDGNDDAANRLFARYLPQLHRWAHGRLPRWARDVLDTGDLVQDAAYHTFKQLPSFEPRGDGALFWYLRRSLVNRIRDQLRAIVRRPAPAPLADHPDTGESPFDLTASREKLDRYLAALKRLRAEDRDAIVARLERGCTYEQLAEVLGKSSAEAARLAVRRALIRLAREMDHV
jgi:RNA polymerase sigma-70 factor (ECF subfamily)